MTWWSQGLASLSDEQWESLCDRCGRCCLVKLEDIDSGDLHYTAVRCRLLDDSTCQCANYPQRLSLVPDCIKVNRDPKTLARLPSSCAYRRISEGRELAWWHRLISGDSRTVHTAGISVRGRCICETDVHTDDLPQMIVDWPVSDDPWQ